MHPRRCRCEQCVNTVATSISGGADMEWRQHTKSEGTQNVFPEFLPSFDPQLEADHENEHQRPWTTFSEIFTHITNYPHTQNITIIDLGSAFYTVILLTCRTIDNFVCFWYPVPILYFLLNYFFFISPVPTASTYGIYRSSVSEDLSEGLLTVAYTAVIQCYRGCYNSVYMIRSPTGLAIAPLMTNDSSQTWHQWVSHPDSLWWDQLFKLFVFLPFFPSMVLNVCQSVFVTVWVSFSINEELVLQHSINIRCDQSTRNPKQAAEQWWGVSFFKNATMWDREWIIVLYVYSALTEEIFPLT